MSGDVIDIHDHEAAVRELERTITHLITDKNAKLRCLAVEDHAKLESLRNSLILRDRVNARALHARLISRLRNRRFELQYLDRPYQVKTSSTSSSGKRFSPSGWW